MNAILPVVLFAIYFMIPQTVPIGQAQIVRVSPDTPAAAAGLKPGDFIVQIDGHTMESLPDVSRQIQLHQGQTMDWVIKRSGQLQHVSVYARFAVPTEIDPITGKKTRQGPTGIQLNQVQNFTDTRSYPFWEAIPMGVRETRDSLILMKNQVISFIASRTAPQLQGPVGIAQTTGQVVKEAGWAALLQLAAILSINLAIVNILPLPMLDGGRILFVVIEILRRGKRIAPEKEALVHLVGFALIISAVVLISYFDIARLVHGENLVR
jgi:regulator of sigma E protease